MVQKHLEGLKTIRVLGFDLAFASPTGWAIVTVPAEQVLDTGLIIPPSGRVTLDLQRERARKLYFELINVCILGVEKAIDLIAYETPERWLLAKARSPFRFSHRTQTNIETILRFGAGEGILWAATHWAAPKVPLKKLDPNIVRGKFSKGLIIPPEALTEAETRVKAKGVKAENLASVAIRTGFWATSTHEADAIMLAIVAGYEHLWRGGEE